MATSTPWAVTITKRNSCPDTLLVKKPRTASSRTKATNDQAALRKQQTLTQIQWVSEPTDFDEALFQPRKTGRKRKSASVQKPLRLMKRDSTLTQMDFLLDTPSFETDEDDMKPLVMLSEARPALPQLDGSCENYAVPQTSTDSKSNSHRKRKSTSLHRDEHREFASPAKRRKEKANHDNTSHELRRSVRQRVNATPQSSRGFATHSEAPKIAASPRLNPDVGIIDSVGFKGDLNTDLRRVHTRSPNRQQFENTLEIQNSIEDVDDENDLVPLSPLKYIPMTPRVNRQCIPSSQSPESLPPSTTKRKVKHTATTKRDPLGERSINNPIRRCTTEAESDYKALPTSKKKICTLKLPRVSLASMKKKVEDSQVDIWSLQPTSSPKSRGDSQRIPQLEIHSEIIPDKEAEIPSTSQIQSESETTSSPPQFDNANTQESLPSLSDAIRIGTRKSVSGDNNAAQSFVPAEIIMDAGVSFSISQQTTPKRPLNIDHVRSQFSSHEEADGGDDDDFGSPIANDTHFVQDIQARIPTSPLVIEDHLKALHPSGSVSDSSSSSGERYLSASALATPKLVDRVEYQMSTSIVPINDVSSPILPPKPTHVHQPIAPASIPHPSQVSTQEPSQQLPQLSSMPPLHSPTSIKPITIKDSSSMHEHLSQIPEYNEDELQLHRELLHTQQITPEDEDDEYDDLDPRSPRMLINRTTPKRVTLETPALESTSKQDPEPSQPPSPADFTQNGHVTAARIEKMRKRGLIPPGYDPPPFQVRPLRELLPAWMFEDEDEEL